MHWKTVAIVVAAFFLGGFLLGFVPEYRKASKLAQQLQSARLQSKLREIRAWASLSYIDATKLNYGSAAEDSERMFGIAHEVLAETKDDSLRNSLDSLLTFRDTIRGKLSAADASVLQPLQQIVQKTRAELSVEGYLPARPGLP